MNFEKDRRTLAETVGFGILDDQSVDFTGLNCDEVG
jgi:hypothetical protein